ncbi:ethanolamine utilization protein EutH [Cellulosilyticum sp. I15G10I2]|uniref:ethanolamine utilization protein EutH n=1 Tax=Cellulosilyticum sp. I15G10I2 TaxID=1892843 RepID=UPI00085C9D4C|nr:ethanolamine utilization protein EutH [Cellulosilyticum sp. I15G10I2]
MFNELIQNITNWGVFTTSFQEFLSNMSVNMVIMVMMMIFMVVGAIDKVRGNKRGYGEKFDDGFNAMGPLAIAMIGVVALAPVLRILLQPIIAPVYQMLGANPAMFATTLLANDMGGYPLAMQLAGDNEVIGNFAGLILGAMMGPTIVFTIPVALSIIKKEDRPYLACGILVGLITIPIGCIVGGLTMNMTQYKISMGEILINLVPVMIIAGLIAIGLWFRPTKMMNGFMKFGNAITIIITIGTAIAVFQYQTGIRFPLFDVMVDADKNGGSVPLEEGIMIVGAIAIVLIGAFPMVHFITKNFAKPLMKFGKMLGVGEKASAGFVATLANNIPMFNIMHEMDPKGKILNVAFAVAAAFVFGDHLGFTAGVNPDMIFAVVLGKLTAGITAVILAAILAPKLLSKVQASQEVTE